MGRERRRLSAKAIVPAQVGLVRERLFTVAQNRLGLALAPAGYGKTRLLAQVADAFDGAVCWYRADSADREPTLLLAKLGDALLRSLEIPAVATSWEQVLGAVAGERRSILLVVDDLHELDGSESEQSLASLIESAPGCLRILLAGRRWPALDMRHLRVSGESAVVEAADLQFRSWEVEHLFRDVYEEPLVPEDAAALTRRTGGWAAGLAMFRLLTAGRSPADRRRAVSELGGGSRLVRSYLVREVLEELQPEIREFLRRTCALGVLTADRCDALLGRSDSQQMLDDLERRQLFISTEDGIRYRYHQVLQDHLELELLEQFGTSAAQEWYERAASQLELAGEVSGAFRAYIRAEQWAAVQRLLHVRGADVVAKPLGPVAERIPLSLSSEDPWLVLAEARRLLRHGTLARAVAAYRKAESLTADLDLAALCRMERRQAALWLPGDDVPTGDWTGTVRAATRKRPQQAARIAAARCGPEDRLVAGLAELLDGALDQADAVLRYAAQDPGAGQDLVRIAVYARTFIGLLVGRVRSDLPELEAVVLDAEVADRPWWARLGCALLEADAGCLTALDQMRAQAEAEEDRWGSGIIRLLRGIVARDADALEDAAAGFGQLNAPVLQLWANCLAAALTGERRPYLVRQAWFTAQVLDARGVPPAAQRWAGQTAATFALTSPPQPTVRLRVLGGFELTIGGVPVDQFAVRPRARKALHVLAMHVGRPVHREMLTQAVWPDSSPDAARRSVHVAISSLRHLLEADAPHRQSLLLPRLGDSYMLALPDGSSCDLLNFQAALASARTARLSGDVPTERTSLRRALSCYGGDLLPEDGSAEWVVADRDRLRLAAADAGEQLARAEAASGDVTTAVEQARRALTFDTYRDSTWRLLIELHERAGDLSAAHAVRRQYGKILAELGAVSGAGALSNAPCTRTNGIRKVNRCTVRAFRLTATRGPATDPACRNREVGGQRHDKGSHDLPYAAHSPFGGGRSVRCVPCR
jgi:DNA-binding SARP family transcriptional activator